METPLDECVVELLRHLNVKCMINLVFLDFLSDFLYHYQLSIIPCFLFPSVMVKPHQAKSECESDVALSGSQYS